MTEMVSTIRLTRPLPHQRVVLDHPARFKILCWGRRTGKTRASWGGTWLGHGPKEKDGRPKWRGVLHGIDVAWIARDFPQSMALWEEEIRPRFSGVEGVYLNEQKRCVRLEGAGTLWVKSFENIDSVRGLGKNLGGVVCEESAWWDLERAWRKVLRPALMDNQGWAMFPSSPNYLHDGNKEQRIPSYFNLLCDQVASGRRNADWGLWEGDARMNPRIEPREFDELVAEYTADSDDLKQEVYGQRLTSGVGIAFPEFSRHVHVREIEPDYDDVPCAGLDWGYSSPGWFGRGYKGASRLLLRDELYFQRQKPRAVGKEIGALLLSTGRVPLEIVADSSIFDTADGGITIAERIQEGLETAWIEAADRRTDPLPPVPQVVPTAKGPGSIRTRTLLLKEELAYKADDDGEIIDPPHLLIHPSCTHFVRVVATIPLDPKKPEQFNTDVEDHPIDGWTYLLISRDTEWRGSTEHARATVAARGTLDALSRQEAQAWDKQERELMQRRGRKWSNSKRGSPR